MRKDAKEGLLSAVNSAFWKERDLPERFGPMMVKELRQGLRRGIFVYPFMLIHLLAAGTMIAEFEMGDQVASTSFVGVLNLLLFIPGTDGFSGPFWAAVGLICLVLMPMGGIVLMGQELEEGNHELLLLTPIDRWRVVWGKFLALWGINLLTFVSLLPYVIVRYLIGGMDVWRNLSMSLTVVLFSGMLAAGAIGASSFSGIPGRIFMLFLFVGSMLFSLAIALLSAASTTNSAGIFFHLNGLGVAFCYVLMGLALARSRIRLVVHQFEVQPTWMMGGLLFFTPFVIGMASFFTANYASSVGAIGMGLVAWFADIAPKAHKSAVAQKPNIPPPLET